MKKSRGCFFWGCMIVIILAVLGAIATAIVVYALYSAVNNMVNEYTGTAPEPVPTITLTDDQKKALDDKWAAFKKAVENDEAAELVLTGDELTALITEQMEKLKIKGQVNVKVENDEISSKMSIPIDFIPLFGKGRYLNGEGVFAVKLENGDLDIRLKSGELNKKKTTPEVIQQFSQVNLADSFMNNPDSRKEIRKFESISVKGDKVILKAKKTSKTEGDDEEKKEKADEPAKEEQSKAKEEAKAKEPVEEKPAPPAEPAKTDLPKAA